MIEVPDAVREKARAAGATGWLAALPDLVAGLERDWAITVGEPFRDGTEAFVAAAADGDGTPLVLKVMVPRPDGPDHARNEITVLRLADGQGCVRLHRADEARGALLVDRLGPSLHDLGLPVAQRHDILCAVAQRLWRPAAGHGLPTGAQKARWLIEFIGREWEALDRPCSAAAVEHALTCAHRRETAHDDDRAVLVHGDVHEWNTLSTGDGGWALVDPDGLLAEPEYDLGVILREDPLDGDPHERAHRLAERTGLDPVAVREWGVVERVSTGLVCERIGLPVGRQMLAVAERVANCDTHG